ncbi:MAG: cytochrome-c peroxidase [Acidobacteria bacterium]|nr:cytochrome-c peroxidase [Acidobacteriota bacterium]
MHRHERVHVPLLGFALLLTACGGPSPPPETATRVPPPIPPGLEADLRVPADNPMTPARVDLGRLLYFDPRLSRDHTVSCSTCHNPALGFSDGLPTSVGVDSRRGSRNAPTVVNSTYLPHQFWDGRAATLEEQALGPIQNPLEMDGNLDEVVATLAEIPEYRRRSQEAYGSPIDAMGIARAIAAFERTLLSGNSAWDRFNLGDENALTPAARRGWDLFRGRANCTSCHVGFLLTDFDFHNLGVGMGREEPDPGRFRVTGEDRDRGAFKTPGLREVSRTAPYMHDGSLPTLWDVIDLYDRGGEPNPWLDPAMKPIGLSAPEKRDLIAFLESLQGDPPVRVDPPALPDLVRAGAGG